MRDLIQKMNEASIFKAPSADEPRAIAAVKREGERQRKEEERRRKREEALEQLRSPEIELAMDEMRDRGVDIGAMVRVTAGESPDVFPKELGFMKIPGRKYEYVIHALFDEDRGHYSIECLEDGGDYQEGRSWLSVGGVADGIRFMINAAFRSMEALKSSVSGSRSWE